MIYFNLRENVDGEENGDCHNLGNVLNKLYEYIDSDCSIILQEAEDEMRYRIFIAVRFDF